MANDYSRDFNEEVESMSYLMFFLIVLMASILYSITAPTATAVDYVAYCLIGFAELLILSLAVSSRINIYRMDHPKKNYLSEPICEGAVS